MKTILDKPARISEFLEFHQLTLLHEFQFLITWLKLIELHQLKFHSPNDFRF